MEKYIKILFCVPYDFWKEIKVNKQSKIKCLMNEFKDGSKYTFIFNGSIIDIESSFEKIGIPTGKIIMAIKKNEEQFNESDFKWMKLSKDPYFESRLHILTNPKMMNEFDRIRDIRELKIEGSFKLNKKYLHKMYLKQEMDFDEPLDFNLDKLNLESISSPNEEPLPIIW